MNSHTFETNSAREKYQEFLEDYQDCKQEPTNTRRAKHAYASAWEILDWLYKESTTSLELGSFRTPFFQGCPSLLVMHDLANAAKHKILDRPKADIQNTQTKPGAFSAEFSNAFDKTRLEIEFEDGRVKNFETEIDQVKSYWDSYFLNYP
ncbi:hypothetical protein K6T82_11310 [Flavobacterium sp. 17A]|uniref:Uncharacterized protein n=1 Tax=Flavobacterium potami TaxID=2872310 RepID=A0A9X1HAT3_9FLAO|nr:hypothetical protein [Flavobacterium potami]MBZ4035356.1 hypothetical protein [Flavobacterium potami]